MPTSPVDTRREYNKVWPAVVAPGLESAPQHVTPVELAGDHTQRHMLSSSEAHWPMWMACLQVAMQMGAPVRKKDPVATSPYGTPKGARSPLSRCQTAVIAAEPTCYPRWHA